MLLLQVLTLPTLLTIGRVVAIPFLIAGTQQPAQLSLQTHTALPRSTQQSDAATSSAPEQCAVGSLRGLPAAEVCVQCAVPICSVVHACALVHDRRDVHLHSRVADRLA